MVPVILCSDVLPYIETIETYTMTNLDLVSMNIANGTINFNNPTIIGSNTVTISASLNNTPPLVFNMPMVLTGYANPPSKFSLHLNANSSGLTHTL